MPVNPALQHPDPARMVTLLEEALSPAHRTLLRLIESEAVKKKLPLYIIGGFVRDLFVGYPGWDFDLVVVGNALAFARGIARAYGGRITVHSQFGTASWEPDLAKIPGVENPGSVPIPPLDFVTARSETYAHPGALPEVKAGSLADDLSRRDFTINALALCLDGDHYGELVDQAGGLGDLREGIVRVLHSDSYVDDPTRILRAVRYEKRYDFHIFPADLDLIAAAKSHLSGLSGERLRHELDLILAEENSAAMLNRLQELDILAHIHPLLAWDEQKARLFAALDQPEAASWQGVPDLLHQPRRVALSYLLWLGSLEPPAIHELAARLDFTASLREALLANSSLRKMLPSLPGKQPSQVVAALEGTPLLVICAASLAAEPVIQVILENYLARWRHIRAHTTGDELVRRGLPPGPAYKEILWQLRAARLDGEATTDEQEIKLLEGLIEEHTP